MHRTVLSQANDKIKEFAGIGAAAKKVRRTPLLEILEQTCAHILFGRTYLFRRYSFTICGRV